MISVTVEQTKFSIKIQKIKIKHEVLSWEFTWKLQRSVPNIKKKKKSISVAQPVCESFDLG